MSFPAAVERVGRINQFRVKKAEDAAISSLNSPAVQTFKEYADDNPMGLRWAELKAPALTPESLPEGWRYEDGYYVSPKGDYLQSHPNESAAERDLREALSYEGDTMGHCVGGYCDDVASGQSRIFSLRDAKGEPHVTIETAPGDGEAFYRDAFMRLRQQGVIGPDDHPGMAGWDHLNSVLKNAGREPFDLTAVPERIVQIKGKQNRAPKDDYLPFVQDFVKSGQWGDVGDLRNTNLVRLPDGRYLDNSVVKARLEQRAKDRGNYNPEYWDRERDKYHNGLDPEQWDQVKDYFEGYAIGGRVDADRCFSYNPLTVRRGR